MVSEYVWTVRRENDFLIYSRNGVDIYEPMIPAPAASAMFMQHMSGKNWMTQELKSETVRLVQEWWGE